MGREVVRLFCEIGYDTWVVCRKHHTIIDSAHFFYGNVMDDVFMAQVLHEREYDAIVDFMWYNPDTFASRVAQLLSATKHYICLSSAAVSAHSNKVIQEDYPRFYDIASEKELNDKGCHYHLDKARIENTIRSQNQTNWTIIRPHVTLNSNHLPLTIWAESVWLWRATHKLPVVVYEDLLKPLSSYTMASDVAKMIAIIVEKGEPTFCETYNVVSDTILTGEQLLNLYDAILKRHGYQMDVVRLPDSSSYHRFSPMGYERITYDRAQNRVFDNAKIKSIADIQFVDFSAYLEKCVEEWLLCSNSEYLENTAIRECVLLDKLSNTPIPWKYLRTKKDKKDYIIQRYFFIRKAYNILLKPFVGLYKHAIK